MIKTVNNDKSGKFACYAFSRNITAVIMQIYRFQHKKFFSANLPHAAVNVSYFTQIYAKMRKGFHIYAFIPHCGNVGA